MSDGLPWYKCDPRDLNDGYAGLTLAERGAYNTIINRIYIEGGPIPDVALYLCSFLGCGVAEWSAVRRRLLKLDKLRVVMIDLAPHLTNQRCEREIAAYQEIAAKRRRGGLASVRARGLKPRNPLKVVDD